MQDVILAIDIGGSKYMAGLVDGQGRILDAARYPWGNVTTGEAVLAHIRQAAQAMLDAHPGIKPRAIGATIPGLADPRTGMWVEASFSGVGDVAVGPALQAAFGAPAFIDNDGQACALAEKLYGACKDVKDFLYLTVSNGCGGAIFMGDLLYYGASGNAGEIGHVCVEPQGRPCNCGARGCLEMHAAGPALVKNYLEVGGLPKLQGQAPNAKAIADLARGGDPAALETYRLEGVYLGRAIAAACNLLNPSKVIIGGGVSLAFDLFEASLWDTLRQYIYWNANQQLTIQPTALGYNGGLLGAAAVAVCGLENRHGWGMVESRKPGQ